MNKTAKFAKIAVVEPEIEEEEEEELDVKFLTPHEAEARVCPMGIGGEPVSVKGNIVGKRCLSDLCMAWRWGDDETGYCGFVG